jgi:hypothetical protein
MDEQETLPVEPAPVTETPPVPVNEIHEKLKNMDVDEQVRFYKEQVAKEEEARAKELKAAEESSEPSPELVERALAAGFTRDELKSMPETAIRKSLARMAIATTPPRDGAEVTSNPPPKDELDLGAEFNDFDPAVKTVLTKMKETILSLKKEVEVTRAEREQNVSNNFFNELDRRLAAEVEKEPDLEVVLGKGEAIALKSESAKRNRVRVAEMMQGLASLYQSQGKSVTFDELYNQAKFAVLGQDLVSRTKGTLTNLAKNRSSSLIPKSAKASSDIYAGLSGEARAALAIGEKMRAIRDKRKGL